MGGYDKSRSMSNNAKKAFKKGLKPLYKITNEELKKNGWPLTLSFARWLANKGIWKNEEWHHTGHNFKCTNFYSIDTLTDFWYNLSEENQSELKKSYSNTKVVSGGKAVSGYYEDKETGEKLEFSGILKGSTIYLDEGGTKKINGKNIWYS